MHDVTTVLIRMGLGDKEAAETLLPLVYDHLRAQASAYFRGQGASHTLQPTALVHEAYLRLVQQDSVSWKDRAHFFAVAATAMRQILTDHARGRRVATAARSQPLTETSVRPVYAGVAADNLASIRLLEKRGFTVVGRERGFAKAPGAEIEELTMRLE